MHISRFERWYAQFSFTTEERQRIYQVISVMLQSKLGIDQILAELYERESRNGQKPRESTAIMLAEWQQVIRNGGRLADAVAEWVPQSEQMVIMAGEEAGNLPKQMEALIQIIEMTREIKTTIRNGLFYPAILLLATFVYLYLFGLHLIPQFTVLTDPMTWKPIARSLYHMSQFMTHYGLLTLVAMILPVILIAVTLPTFRGNARVICDRLPPWSLYRLVVGAGFMHSLGALLRGGGRINDAFAGLRRSSSPYLAERINAFMHGVHSGLDAGAAMRNSGFDFPSREIVADLTIYAKHSADFGEALEKVSAQWMKYGLQSIQAQMKVINGLAIVVMGLTLMWIVAGFFGIQQEIASMARSAGR